MSAYELNFSRTVRGRRKNMHVYAFKPYFGLERKKSVEYLTNLTINGNKGKVHPKSNNHLFQCTHTVMQIGHRLRKKLRSADVLKSVDSRAFAGRNATFMIRAQRTDASKETISNHLYNRTSYLHNLGHGLLWLAKYFPRALCKEHDHRFTVLNNIRWVHIKQSKISLTKTQHVSHFNRNLTQCKETVLCRIIFAIQMHVSVELHSFLYSSTNS